MDEEKTAEAIAIEAGEQQTITPPPPTPPPVPTPQPSAVREALLAATRIDWTTVDLDLPRNGFVCSTGAELERATATIRCDCGTTTEIEIDGESRSRCPNCKAIFRHALLVQREDQTPATPCLLIAAILEEAGIGPGGV